MIAAAARDALIPLGFWREGRSRVWLADRGFWLAVVEFQPSSFSKGSYLNVSAHWLWSAMPEILSFDYRVQRQQPWIKFEDVAQFGPLVDQLAQQAAKESRQLEAKIGDIRSAAAVLVAEETAYANEGRGGGWPAFNAAIASGIVGDMVIARKLFSSAYHSIGAGRPDLQRLLVPYSEAIKKKSTFSNFIALQIDKQRAKFKLSPFKK